MYLKNILDDLATTIEETNILDFLRIVKVRSYALLLVIIQFNLIFVFLNVGFWTSDWDECACRAENDCSMSAECINTKGSYICSCKTDTDANPARPGRNCEGKKIP